MPGQAAERTLDTKGKGVRGAIVTYKLEVGVRINLAVLQLNYAKWTLTSFCSLFHPI